MAENFESSTTSAEPAPRAISPVAHFGIGSLIIVPLLLVGVTVGKQGSMTTATPAAVAAPTPEATTAPAPAAVATIAPESSSLKSELEDLSAQLKQIQAKVDGLPKPEPAPDLMPLEGKIDAVSKSITVARPLLAKVDKLEGHIDDVGKQIESLQSKFMALKQSKSSK